CADSRHLRLLRAHRGRPRSCRAAECEYEFSPSDVGCHATLPWGQQRGTISRFTEGCSCAAKILSRECLSRVCAVTRRRFPVGASPTRRTLQPEATGAAMEVTKWLKPSDSASRLGDGASVQAVTRVNAEQASKRTMRRPTRRPFRGRLIRLGEMSKVVRPDAAPG